MNEPVVCPKCESDDITAGQFEQYAQDYVERTVVCETCGHEWVEEFVFLMVHESEED